MSACKREGRGRGAPRVEPRFARCFGSVLIDVTGQKQKGKEKDIQQGTRQNEKLRERRGKRKRGGKKFDEGPFLSASLRPLPILPTISSMVAEEGLDKVEDA